MKSGAFAIIKHDCVIRHQTNTYTEVIIDNKNSFYFPVENTTNKLIKMTHTLKFDFKFSHMIATKIRSLLLFIIFIINYLKIYLCSQ